MSSRNEQALSHVVAVNIRAAREQQGLSQEALARAIEVSVVSVRRWEREDCPPPKLPNLAAIALATGRRLEWFLKDRSASSEDVAA